MTPPVMLLAPAPSWPSSASGRCLDVKGGVEAPQTANGTTVILGSRDGRGIQKGDTRTPPTPPGGESRPPYGICAAGGTPGLAAHGVVRALPPRPAATASRSAPTNSG